jgi:hypothetical protein
MAAPKCTPARASSSSTTASCAKLPPPPPYFLGNVGEQDCPARPAAVQAARRVRAARASAPGCGTNSFSTNWRTALRKMRTSSSTQGDSYADAVIGWFSRQAPR